LEQQRKIFARFQSANSNYPEALEQLILPGTTLRWRYIIRGANDRRNKGLYRANKPTTTN
jgi:hypothetical protein